MDINYMSMQSNAINYSKKHLRELIQLKLTNSLDELEIYLESPAMIINGGLGLPFTTL
jgi:hypothetical protein